MIPLSWRVLNLRTLFMASGFGRVSTLVSIPLFRKRFQLSMRTNLLPMMLLKIIMREEYVLVGVAIISSFLSMCLMF